jgi:formate dehydrogenase subunit gamma
MTLILLGLGATPVQEQTETFEGRAEETPQPAAAVDNSVTGAENGGKILRFYESERMIHWAIVMPFLICYLSALVLVVFYNPHPLRPYRAVFSWIHRISGVSLVVLPLTALYKGRRDIRIHLHNIKEASTWVRDDFKWLALMLLAEFNSKIRLPEQGKFNAAEKVNFLVLLGTYPLYIATGLLLWMKYWAFLAWAVHVLLALLATPLIFGHMYMALLNSGGRPGLQGMISGFVDREWAKHHYGHWYSEHYGAKMQQPTEEEARESSLSPGPAEDDGAQCGFSPSA